MSAGADSLRSILFALGANFLIALAKTAGAFPIPVAIVPGHLSDEDIDASS